jgi:hypothetical protein
MSKINTKLRIIKTLFGIVLLAMAASFSLIVPAHADSLYTGDGGDDTVKKFDARTGAYLGEFVSQQGNGGLLGPRGLIFTQGRLHLVNQNVSQDYAGEVLRYRRDNGAFLNALVPCNPNPPLSRVCNDNAPFAPRGAIRGSGNSLYVAEFIANNDFYPGSVKKFDLGTGQFLGKLQLDASKFSPESFFPRGIVHGPDDLLYVSVTGNLAAGDGISGYILRFNPRTGKFVDVFISNLASDCATHLHRPEGLVFSPDNKLYVTAFRADPNDTDKILIFNRKGQCIDSIELDAVGQPRAFSQAILFGQNGRLFVPINNTGEVRRYNVRTKAFDVFIPAGGVLISPWYLSFGETDPRTLEYDD